MKKYNEDSDEEEQELRPVAKEDSQESLPIPTKKSAAAVDTVDLHDDEEGAIADAVGDKFDVSSSDEEIVRKVKKAAPRKLGPSMIKEGSTKTGNGKPVPKKGAAVKKKFVQSSDDEKPMKRGRKAVGSGDDDSDFEVENVVAKPRGTGNFMGRTVCRNKTSFDLDCFNYSATGGRKKADVNYGQGDSSDSDF